MKLWFYLLIMINVQDVEIFIKKNYLIKIIRGWIRFMNKKTLNTKSRRSNKEIVKRLEDLILNMDVEGDTPKIWVRDVLRNVIWGVVK